MTTKERVLNWINTQRKSVGADPKDDFVPGEPGNMDYCTVALTFENDNDNVIYTNVEPNEYDGALRKIGNSWGYLSYFRNDDTLDKQKVVRLPKYVAKFAMDFDHGDYPELLG